MSEDTYLSILNAQSPINITGNIFICNQLCQLEIEYTSLNQLSLTSASNTLFWNLPTSQINPGKIIFNGGDNSSTKLQDYYLKEIIMVGPSKLLMNNQSFNFQLNFVHQSEDGKRNIILIVFIQASDSPISRKTLPHRYFDAIIQNGLPTMEQTTLPINTITEWNPNELIPDDQSFYSFIGQDNVTNYIVFQNPIQMSTSAQNMLIDQIYGGLQIFNQNALDPKKVTNPENLILYGNKPDHNIIKKINTSPNNISSIQTSSSQENEDNQDTTITVKPLTDNESPNIVNIPIITPDIQQTQTSTPTESTSPSPYYQKVVQIIWYVLIGISVIMWLVYYVWNKMSFGSENINILPYIISFILKISIIIKVISLLGFIVLRYFSDWISNAIGSAQFTKVTSVLEKIGGILYTIGYGSFVLILDILVIYLFNKKESFANIELPNPNLSFMNKIVYYFRSIIKNTPFISIFDSLGKILNVFNIPVLDKIKQLPIFQKTQINTKERILLHSPNTNPVGQEEINPQENVASISKNEPPIPEQAAQAAQAAEGSVIQNEPPIQPIPEPDIPEPAIPEPDIPEPAIPEPDIPEPAIPEPAIPEPAIPEPAIPKPVAEGNVIQNKPPLLPPRSKKQSIPPPPLPPRSKKQSIPPPPLPPRRPPPAEAFVRLEEVTPENEEKQRKQREENNRIRREENNRKIREEKNRIRKQKEMNLFQHLENITNPLESKKKLFIPTTNITPSRPILLSESTLSTSSRPQLSTQSRNNPVKYNFTKPKK
jgi:carbonic anhydrase